MRILITLISCLKYLIDRNEYIDTWTHNIPTDVDLKIIVGLGDIPETDFSKYIIQFPVDDRYGALTYKIHGSLQYADLHKYDIVIRVTDDIKIINYNTFIEIIKSIYNPYLYAGSHSERRIPGYEDNNYSTKVKNQPYPLNPQKIVRWCESFFCGEFLVFGSEIVKKLANSYELLLYPADDTGIGCILKDYKNYTLIPYDIGVKLYHLT